MKLYNTQTRKVEIFEPLNEGKVNMFACGPTVYDFSHIGNGRTAITMDVLARFLRYLGYDLFYLVNITDIDDKIIIRSNEQGITWKELSQKYEKQYKHDMDRLNINIDEYARATDYIEDIKSQVNRLMQAGYAYKIDDGIYFEISKFKDYGKLSGRAELKKDDAISRIDQNDQKHGWNDFCLWKFSKKDEPSWPAEFGDGRPGWHIEDTAITEHFFGSQYDIHGGGSDLIFPHHEAELTQMEAISGKVPFVKYWVHGGLLFINDQRMGKSNKNFYTINDVLNKYPSSVIRLFMLQGHYRSILNFSFELLDTTLARVNRWKRVADLGFQPREISSYDFSNIITKITDLLQDDLNTPSAISLLETSFFDPVLEQGYIGQNQVDEFNKVFEFINLVFGINLLSEDLSQEQIDLIIERENHRQTKNWRESDKIRDILLKQGIELNDNSFGVTWTRPVQ